MGHLDATLDEFRGYAIENNLRGRLLDVGCKNSMTKDFFKNLAFDWVGIDISPEDHEVSKMLMENLHFDRNEFDVVFVCHSLEHCENPIKAINEFKRVLKNRGILFISLPCHCKHHVLESDDDHIFCFTDMQIERILKYCGLEKLGIYKGNGGYNDREKFNLIAIARKYE